jgi:hypothetical protein
MPDDYHPPMPRRNPEDVDLGAIKADLEFLIVTFKSLAFAVAVLCSVSPLYAQTALQETIRPSSIHTIHPAY